MIHISTYAPIVSRMSITKDVKIRVKRETRSTLKALKRGGESYDAVIRGQLRLVEKLRKENEELWERLGEKMPEEAEG